MLSVVIPTLNESGDIARTIRHTLAAAGGAPLDLVNPSPDAWTDEDLALRLARTYRWGGESTWTWPLSVAQHSLLVLALRREWARSPLTLAEQRAELLHDAEEGFLGFDCISPLKRVLGPPFAAVADRLMHAVSQRYDLPAWTPNRAGIRPQQPELPDRRPRRRLRLAPEHPRSPGSPT